LAGKARWRAPATSTHRFQARPFARALLAFIFCLRLVNPAFQAVASNGAIPSDSATVLIVVGAPGEEEFGASFAEQAQLWAEACEKARARRVTIGLDAPGEGDDLTRLRTALEAEPKEGADAWLVLIGHGTFDGKEARFGLRGPDLSATDLAAWLRPFRRPLAILNTASASAPFLSRLSGSNRVVVMATRSGYEQNFTRLGIHLAAAIHDPAADLDQDGQTSLLEAFLSASFQVAEFYKGERRLATEHALIDDNGDGLGTPADWFRGLRAVKRPKDAADLDGLRAHQVHLVRSAADHALSTEQRARRDTLEWEIAALREEKANLPETEYYRRLGVLARELALLYRAGAAAAPAPVPMPSRP
jgi:hypothetical protein